VVDRPQDQGRSTRHSDQPIAQVRGVLADRVVVSTPLDPFLSLRALAAYSGLGARTLRGYLTDRVHPLPCYRIGGKILIRRSEYDALAAHYRRLGSPDLDRIAAQALRDLSVPPSQRRRIAERP